MVDRPVLLFDGVCNLCCSSVRFVLKHDREGVFRFAPLQSDAGRRLAPNQTLDTVVLVDGAGVHTRSTAVLKTLKYLPFPWPVFYYTLIILPRALRDAVYNAIGTRRYGWFGRKDACWVPDSAVKERFLNQ